MSDVIKVSGGKPTCPNHGSVLEGTGWPLPKKGTGQCPVSGALFAFEADVEEGTTEYEKDHSGNLVPKPKWNISGSD